MPPRDFGQPGRGRGTLRHLVDGALNFVPLWVCIGIGAFVLVQEKQMGGIAAALLVATAALGLFELRRYWLAPPPRLAPAALRPAPAAAAPARQRSFQLKQTLMLAGLVGAYLHYYFWDVQVQIASLPHVTVFAAVPLSG